MLTTISGKQLYEMFFLKNGRFNKAFYDSLPESNESKKCFKDIYFELFKDFSKKEKKYRLINEIFETPKCPICKKELIFLESKGRFQNHCSLSCAALDPNTKTKYIDTCKKKYGSIDNFNKIKSETYKKTCNEKYGVKSYMLTTEFKEKSNITKHNKYGSKNWNNPNKAKETLKLNSGVKARTNKIKQTILKNYNANSYLEHYYKENERNTQEILDKINNTKRKNNTFNTSKAEEKAFLLLKEKFSDVITQYKTDKYPFVCDFYIPNLDLYIECNFHWTHGGKPFDSNDPECIKLLNLWRNKNTKFYNNAITTWTIRDPKKRETAKKNNINYKEFWNINELKEFIYE